MGPAAHLVQPRPPFCRLRRSTVQSMTNFDNNVKLPPPLQSVQLIRGRSLCSRPLTSDRHAHRMPPAPVRTHIPQSLDITPQFSPELVANLHV